MAADERMSAAQRAYEAKRAEKAGKSLEAWLNEKRKREAAAAKPTAAPPPAPKKPSLISRLLDRAHKPL
jgi:hypothetical protein